MEAVLDDIRVVASEQHTTDPFNACAHPTVPLPYAVAGVVDAGSNDFPRIALEHHPKAIEEAHRLLASGEVPQWLLEELRIVPIDSKTTRKFQAELMKLARELFPDYDFAGAPPRFLLSDSETGSACQIRGSHPPVFVFSKGMLDSSSPRGARTWDERAAIFVHECGHHFLGNRYGLSDPTKPEEAAADLISIDVLVARRGTDGFPLYNPRALAVYFRRKIELDRDSPSSFKDLIKVQGVIDEHPLDETRLLLLEGRLTQLARKQGDIPNRYTPVAPNDRLYTIASQGSHESYINNILRERRYERMSDTWKSALLSELLRSTDWNQARIDDFSALLAASPKGIGGALADELVSMAGQTGNGPLAAHFYRCLCHFHYAGQTVPLGILADVATAATDFIDAGKDPVETREAAVRLNAAVRRLNLTERLETREFAHATSLPTFPLPTEKHDVVPWDRHVKTALEIPSGDGNPILEALLHLGIEDPRMMRHADVNVATRWLNIYIEGRLAEDYRDRDRRFPGIARPHGKAEIDPGPVPISSWPIDFNIHQMTLNDGVVAEQVNGLTAGVRREQWLSQGYDPLMRDDVVAAIEQQNPSKRHLRVLGDWHAAMLSRKPGLVGLGELAKDPETFLKRNEGKLGSVDNQKELVNELVRLHTANPAEAARVVSTLLIPSYGSSGVVHLSAVQMCNNIQPPESSPLLAFFVKDPLSFIDIRLRIRFLLREAELEKPEHRSFFEHAESVLTDRLGAPLGKGSWNTLPHLLQRVNGILWSESEDNKSQFSDIADHASLSLVRAHKRPASADVHNFLRVLSEAEKEAYAPAVVRFYSEVGDKFRRTLRQSRDYSTNTAEALDQWRLLAKYDLVEHKLLYLDLGSLLDRVDRLPQEDRVPIWERLLTRTTIPDLHVRRRVIKSWASAVASEIGSDLPGRDSRELATAIDRVNLRLYMASRLLKRDMFIELADRIEAQGPLTRVMTGYYSNISAGDFHLGHVIGIGVDATLAGLGRSKRSREALLEYLSGPYTPQAANRFVQRAGTSFEQVIEGIAAISRGGWEAEEALKNRSPELRNHHQRARLGYALLLHQNFWMLSLDQRAAAARELLLPVAESTNERCTEVTRKVLAEVFNGTDDANRETRRALELYIGAHEVHEQPFVITAVMMSGQRTQNGGTLAPAEGIATVCENGGPGEKKAGQAAQSCRAVPKEYRDSLKHLKYLADIPDRMELMKLVDDPAVVPSNVRSSIAHVGKVLGGGAYRLAVEVTLHDGSEAVLVILRPFVKAGAERSFRLMSNVSRTMRESNPAFRALDDIISDGKRRVDVATDVRTWMAQIEKGTALYGNLVITNGEGRECSFKVPGLVIPLGVRKEDFLEGSSLLIERAHGVHFLALPEESDEDRKTKDFFARMICAAEDYATVLGGGADEDPHGGNRIVDIKNRVVYCLDQEGIFPAAPTTSELAQMVEVMVGAMQGEGASATGGELGLAEAFFAQLDNLAVRGKAISPHVTAMQRSFNIRNDYRDCLLGDKSEQSYARESIGSAMKHAHPAIWRALFRQAGWKGRFLAPFIRTQAGVEWALELGAVKRWLDDASAPVDGKPTLLGCIIEGMREPQLKFSYAPRM